SWLEPARQLRLKLLKFRRRYFHPVAQPRLKISDYLWCQRCRLARVLVDQHRHRSRRGDAFSFRKHYLIERNGGSPELRNTEPRLDRARPAQLGAKMDVQAHHDPGQ